MGATGNGTREDPIVISGLRIKYKQLKIENTTLHLVLRDSILVFPGYVALSYNILLYNCSNIVLMNVTIINASYYSIEICLSHNIVVSDIKFILERNIGGVSIYDSKNITITSTTDNCQISNIYVYCSSLVDITHLTVEQLEIVNSSEIHAKNLSFYWSLETRHSDEEQQSTINYASRQIYKEYNIILSRIISDLELSNITIFGGGIKVKDNTRLSDVISNNVFLNNHPIAFCVKASGLTISNVSQAIIYNSTNITLRGNFGPSKGTVLILRSENITITNADIWGSNEGVHIFGSKSINIVNSFLSSPKTSINIKDSCNLKIINNTLSGEFKVLGDTPKYYNHTILLNTINGVRLSYFFNEDNVDISGDIGYAIIVYSHNITLHDITIMSPSKLLLWHTSNSALRNIRVVGAKISISTCDDLRLSNISFNRSRLYISRTNNLLLTNTTFINLSELYIANLTNSKLQNIVVINSSYFGYIEYSNDISIQGIWVKDTSKAFHIYKSSRVSIVNSVFRDVRATITVERSIDFIASNVSIYSTTPSKGISLIFTKNATIKNVAMRNASLYVFGYYVWLYGSYVPATGEYVSGIAYKIIPEYYQHYISNVTINSLPLYYGIEKKDIKISEPYGQIFLVLSENVVITKQNMRDVAIGICVVGSEHVTIENNTIKNVNTGIIVAVSSDINIINNTIMNTNSKAIELDGVERVHVEFNAFINTKGIDIGFATRQIEYNYWSNQTHLDRDNDGVNDYRYDEVDMNPLYKPYTRPKPLEIYILENLMSMISLYIPVILIFKKKFLAQKQQNI